MKDARGHGSNGRGGDLATAQSVMRIPAAVYSSLPSQPMTRREAQGVISNSRVVAVLAGNHPKSSPPTIHSAFR